MPFRSSGRGSGRRNFAAAVWSKRVGALPILPGLRASIYLANPWLNARVSGCRIALPTRTRLQRGRLARRPPEPWCRRGCTPEIRCVRQVLVESSTVNRHRTSSFDVRSTQHRCKIRAPVVSTAGYQRLLVRPGFLPLFSQGRGRFLIGATASDR